MQIVHSLDPLRNAVATLRQVGTQAGTRAGTVALVPTMGALHDGHLTLVREARRQADAVVVSIFVNPLQFGANEDLDAYPRQLERDSRLLEAEGVDLLWAPTVEVMYPDGFASSIAVAGVSEGLCGGARPGHFDGVATVVCKLFNQVLPDLALFGEKDWQQLAVIRRMARDLDLTRPAADSILAVPTVREADGLAMSSRNAYLSAPDRARAAALPAAMRTAIAAIEAGEDVAAALARLEADLAKGGFGSVDYAQLRDARSLEPLDARSQAPMRLLVAARIGGTRLIDNMAVAPA
ncbi:pantoate--beta-alanine ligase [Novosphingobium soli]|uniref:Pantothenate synthetase n=1 Tax=Novosphingobium soli TaxID=574956 RepID=A0ABV6CVY6_9SPHN